MQRNKLSPLTPDRKYGLNWGSGGLVEIIEIESGEYVDELYDNELHWIIRAVFSRDMRRILCLNWDGTVGIWSVPKHPVDPRVKTILDAVRYKKDEFVLRQAHLYHG